MHKTYAKETYETQALDLIAAVRATDETIAEELDKVRPDHRRVASLNAKLGIALKLADVYAHLAIAAALDGPRLLAAGGVDYSTEVRLLDDGSTA